VLQIRVTATGDVRDGAWQVAYGPHLLRFYDGIILHPKNPATAAQRAPMVLAAMTGVAAAASGAVGGSYGSGMMLPSQTSALGALGTNPLAASAAAASTAAALAAGVMARARAALGLTGSSAFGGGLTDVATTQQQQQQLALAALAAQQNPAFSLHGVSDQMATDADAIRRLKAQGRL
jgi:abnormal spindle-like microcephaly-associated protein